MKTSLFSLFVLFAFLFTSSATAKFVLDSRGNPLENGGSYYILPHIWPLGDGLDLAKTGNNETCPLSVVVLPYTININYGLPWTILSPSRIRFVPTNTKLDFFSVEGKVPTCVPIPSKWSILEGEDGIKSVEISGCEKTVEGRFKIEATTSYAYKIVFCPINGDSCKDLGMSSSGRQLVITDDIPLYVVFFKAESSSDAQRASIM
ncbi:factor Xa inhibitor BuXI-like [Prosopis cineraria]|uniref:factor Xa inhibitor BuXI-like n=1 Tax=Prosopis cineraria TaxID=364024 RepID=UPI00240F1DA1|nr:factor Xa inhibitor BuXI-like [Prosopis cineraria]